MNFVNTEDTPSTIKLFANKETNSIYVSWDEFNCPKPYEPEDIIYTPLLSKNGIPIQGNPPSAGLVTIFENVVLNGKNTFTVRIEGNIYPQGEETIHCGTYSTYY
jgi:hypothetical protein